MASIRDIAKKTGLSISTISRYMNGSGYVSEKNGRIIQKAVEELNYVPNKHAQAVFDRFSQTIGLVFPSLVNPYLAQMSTILGNAIQSAGYTSILCFTEDDPVKELEAIQLLMGYRVDGMIIFRAINKEVIADLPFPVVSFETSVSEQTVFVSADNYRGGRMAFDHLYAKGCRNLLHVKGPEKFEATEARYHGFKDAADEKELSIDLLEIKHDYELNEDYQASLRKVDFSKYDGIFVFNDINCLLVVNYLQHNGFRVPEDIKVVGFDYAHMTRFMAPALTTIEQPVKQMADACFSALMTLIRGEELNDTKRIIPVRFIQGQTT